MEVYYDKDFDGRWLISIIRDMNATQLIDTDGVKWLIARDWNGPYKTQLIPKDYSSIWYCMKNPQYFMTKSFPLPEPKFAFPFMTKVWMMATFPKLIWNAFIDIVFFILIVVWMTLNLGSDDATAWWILPND